MASKHARTVISSAKWLRSRSGAVAASVFKAPSGCGAVTASVSEAPSGSGTVSSERLEVRASLVELAQKFVYRYKIVLYRSLCNF